LTILLNFFNDKSNTLQNLKQDLKGSKLDVTGLLSQIQLYWQQVQDRSIKNMASAKKFSYKVGPKQSSPATITGTFLGAARNPL
jgi:hypothetical protein